MSVVSKSGLVFFRISPYLGPLKSKSAPRKILKCGEDPYRRRHFRLEIHSTPPSPSPFQLDLDLSVMRYWVLKETLEHFPSLYLRGGSSRDGILLVNPTEGIGSLLGRRHEPIHHFLVTQKSWRHSLAGLPRILTEDMKSRADVFGPQVHLHGPRGTSRLFRALKYVLLLDDPMECIGVEPLGAQEIARFKIKQQNGWDESSSAPSEITPDFQDEHGIRIQYLNLQSNVNILPSENKFPAWNNLCIDFKDEKSYQWGEPRERSALSYVISDAESKLLVLDVPDDSYLESLRDVIPSVEADVLLDFSSKGVRNKEVYKDWASSALYSDTRVLHLRDVKPPPPIHTVLDRLKKIYPTSVLVQSVKDSSKNTSPQATRKETFPSLTFLGTGSKRRTSHRNVSGILLKVSPESYGLLDCGEGTYHQCLQAFGPEQTDNILKNLRFIFISHRHNDHHLGLFTILQERERLFPNGDSPKLYFIAPRSFKSLLKHYHGLFEDVMTSVFHITPTRLLSDSGKFLLSHLYKKFLQDTGLDFVETLVAPHIRNSYSIHFSAMGWKVLYTGDTQPNPRLRNKAPDVLIHEATLPSHLGWIAHRQHHSSTQDAIDALSESKAGFLILTHFAEPYVIPHLETALNNPNIAIAFDFMTVSPNTLPHIGLTHERFKGLHQSFEKELHLLEQRKKRREWKNI